METCPLTQVLFIKKEIFEKYGYYNKTYKIAGDFEHLLRLIVVRNLKFKILNFIVTYEIRRSIW